MPNKNSRLKVLVAPLNWGLGHATRSIPIIKELLAQNVEVLLASDGRSYELLKFEFPDLKLFKLTPYDVIYSRESMIFNIAAQLPKILVAIYQEHKSFSKIIHSEHIDGIISDNRFGCYNSKVFSVYLTHQLNIKVPLRPVEMFTRLVNRKIIDRFDECWIPDYPGKGNISGELSKPDKIRNSKFIGALSRFQCYELPIKYDILALLSGPEPQRTIFENLVKVQLKNLPFKCIIVQGKTEIEEISVDGNVEIVSHLKEKELNDLIASSNIIISRSGYSTIMDLIQLKKRAIIVPTPGQTEQEYLAEKLYKRKIFFTQTQKEFEIATALPLLNEYGPEKLSYIEMPTLKETISDFLLKCEEKKLKKK